MDVEGRAGAGSRYDNLEDYRFDGVRKFSRIQRL